MAALSQEEIAKHVIARHERAVGERGTWESHWEEIARRVLPNYSGSFTSNGFQTPGAKRTEDMVDATAALALPRFASVCESMLTPRNSKWHRLVPSDPALLKNKLARQWFDDVRDILFRYRYAPNANFQAQNFESYLSFGAFGTGALYIDQLDRRYGAGLRYKAVHLGQIYFLESHQGIIDTAIRKFELTARQAVQQFGAENLPPKIVEANNDQKKCEEKFWFIHCVKPREDDEGYNPSRADTKGMMFASYYVSITDTKIVKEGGHNTFPYAISRYVVAPGETYGRSPAMLALPSIKTLNEMKKTMLKQGHRIVDPVLLAHDDGVADSFSMQPGAINYGGVDAEGRLLVQALQTGNLAAGDKMMDAERFVINDAFLITLFQILTDNPQMTATEVLERTREKGMLLAPTMGRQQSEYLGPMVERELDVLAMQGLLPPLPPMLRDAAGEYDTEFDSPMSRAAKAEEGSGLLRFIDYWGNFAKLTGDVSALDHVNTDSAAPELLDQMAVPNRWVRSPEEVAAVRAARAQQAQQAQMLEAAPAVAGLMKAAQ
jgi:hypothetical protein